MSTSERLDDGLIARLLDHDPSAFEELDRVCRPRLIALVRRQLTGDLRRRLDAEDIVQETLLTFAVHVPGRAYDLRDHDGLWRVLSTIARRKLLKAHRGHHAARRDISRDVPMTTAQGESGQVIEAADPHATAAEMVEAEETECILTQGLPEPDATIVIWWLRGWSIAELERKTGRSRGSIRKLLDDAKARFAHRRRASNRDDIPPPPTAPLN